MKSAKVAVFFFATWDAITIGVAASLAWRGGTWTWPLVIVALINAILAIDLLYELRKEKK